MDFEGAAQRLARDQKKIRGRGTKSVVVSEQARKQAEIQRQQRIKLQEERERKRKIQDYQRQKFRSWERSLRLKSLGRGAAQPEQQQLLLHPTSIYGTGDKLSLPPSVLETLTTSSSGMAENDDNEVLGNPWTFRIGIRNPEYQFPASPLLQNLKPPSQIDDDKDMVDSDDDDENENDQLLASVYRDELAHKYIAYTHGSVVEFTQEEGFVGIPQSIASALLDPKNRRAILFKDYVIPTTRTIDPATLHFPAPKETTNDTDGGEIPAITTEVDEDPTSATPGHVAYGAFDLPNLPLEISLVTLPKGSGCTLVPTEDAVKRGFYLLKDVKLVLEQSLSRTRATLSEGDIVSTWHRGVQFDLHVTKVVPSHFGAVTCINTDIEVDIGETKVQEYEPDTVASKSTPTAATSSLGRTLGSGAVVGASSTSPSMNTPLSGVKDGQPQAMSIDSLLPEPPIDQTEQIVLVQIRHSGGNGKRRFDVHVATVRDLFDFVATLLGGSNYDMAPAKFRLVTRFPRKVYSIEESPPSHTLTLAGIQAGQELFMVEMI